VSKEFNHPIHAFRGFAILNVMAIHMFAFLFMTAEKAEQPAQQALSILARINETLFHDATLYFTIISGILFSTILKERGYKQFFQSKFNYVFLPYVFFSIFYSLGGPSDPAVGMNDGDNLSFITKLTVNLILGSATPIFWYIPVLLILYCLTPLLDKLVSTKLNSIMTYLIILSPLICSRVWPEVSWTNWVYFLGAYLIGMILGTHYFVSMKLIKRYRYVLMFVAIASSLAIYYRPIVPIPDFGVTVLDESAWYVQKFALAGLVLLWFEQVITKVPKWLDVFANYAFALYFVHILYVFLIATFISQMGIPLNTAFSLSVAMLVSFVVMAILSVLTIYLIKKLFGNKSRYVIGA
jgi:surface polysaccharide O-acyltransferase-like enzyme